MSLKRCALFVDFDNLEFVYGAPLTDCVGRWLHWLEDGQFDPAGGRRKFLSKTIYWNDDRKEHFRPLFERLGFKVSMCRAVRKEKASSADFEITIDAVEMRHDLKGLQEIVLLSFDSDFLPLLNHMIVNEVAVWGMADGNNMPAQLYRRLIGTVIERQDFEAAFQYQRGEKNWLGRVPEPAAPTNLHKPAPPPALNVGRGRQNYDLSAALAVLLKAAEQSPSSRLSRTFVSDALAEFEGFTDVGPNAWLGFKYYPPLAEKFTQMSPRLRTETFSNGMKVMVYVGKAKSNAA